MPGIGRAVGRALDALSSLIRICACAVANLLRKSRRAQLPDYVLFELSGQLPERSPRRPWYLSLRQFGAAPPSAEFLRGALRRVAEDPDARGALFVVKGAQLTLARAQTASDIFKEFRGRCRDLYPGAAPKEVAVYLESCGNAEYMMAAAADRVFLAPGGSWMVMGLRAEPIFLAETLRRIGLQAEVVKVAPWKTAADALARSEISDAHRAQLDRLLQGWYDELVAAVARGRAISEEEVRSAIDSAPLGSEDALARRLVDGTVYEDELAAALGSGGRPARIVPFDRARQTLYRRPRRRSRRQIGVISVNGMITPGKSRRFPAELPIVGNNTAGSATVQQLARAALQNDRLAGVLLHVESNGGSALASDVMWRELSLLNRKKPVVAYLGDVAASGGYYAALPAQKIVCQPAALTGSIGVIMGKLVSAEAMGKIGARRSRVQRGANADIYAGDRPWRQEQRAKVEEQVEQVYGRFKHLVAAARKLSPDALEEVCGGRVWTGRQALEKGLVDDLGSISLATELLCELADLPTDGTVPVVQVAADQNRPRPPLSADSLAAAHGAEGLEALSETILAAVQGDLSSLLGRERAWLLADGLPGPNGS